MYAEGGEVNTDNSYSHNVPHLYFSEARQRSCSSHLSKDVIFFNDIVIGHILDNNLSMLECENCDKMYRSKTTLIRHWRQQHGLEGGYNCPLCKRCFGQKSHLDTHLVSCQLSLYGSASSGNITITSPSANHDPVDTLSESQLPSSSSL